MGIHKYEQNLMVNYIKILIILICFCKNVSSVITDDYDEPIKDDVFDNRFANCQQKLEHKLSGAVKPVSYDIKLRLWKIVNMDKYRFTGKVTMIVKVFNTCHRIALHSGDDLEIKEITVMHAKVAFFEYKSDLQYLVIYPKDLLYGSSEYEISITYSGHLKVDYLYVNNSTNIWYVVTKQYPGYVRNIFPCFDEHGLKAKFNITIYHDYAISLFLRLPFENQQNYKIDNQIQKTGLNITAYSNLNLASYEIVLGFCNVSQAQKMKYGVWFPETHNLLKNVFESFRDKIRNQYGINSGIDWMHEQLFINKYTPILRELAIDVNNNNKRHQYEISGIYELAKYLALAICDIHFGETTRIHRSWTDLWLRIGIIQYLATNVLEDANLDDFEVFVDIPRIMEDDGYKGVSQIDYSNDYDSASIRYNSDQLLDSKATLIIRMSIHCDLHITNAEIINATTWQDFQPIKYSKSKLNQQQIFRDSWASEPGIRLVKFIRYERSFTLLMVPFTYNIDEKDQQGIIAFNHTLSVPVTVVLYPNKILTFNLTDEKSLTFATTYKLEGNIIVNYKRYGYYRVLYQNHQLRNFAKQLSSDYNSYDTITRAQLIDDAFNLARVGLYPYLYVIALSKYLTKEFHYLPWKAAIQALDFIDVGLSETTSSEKFQDYYKYLLSPVLQSVIKNIGYAEISNNLKQMKVIKVACRLNMTDCVQGCKSYFNTYKIERKLAVIPANYQETTLCTILNLGNKNASRLIESGYMNAVSRWQEKIFIKSFGCISKLRRLRKKILEFAFDHSSKTYIDDFHILIESAAEHQPLNTLSIIMESVDLILDIFYYEDDVYGISRFLNVFKIIAKKLFDIHYFTLIKRFFNDYGFSSHETAQLVLNIIESNIVWRRRSLPWFDIYFDTVGNRSPINFTTLAIIAD